MNDNSSWDPRTLLVWIFVLTSLSVLTSKWWVLASLVMLCLIGFYLFGVSVSLARYSKQIGIFFIVLVMIQSLFGLPETALITLSGITVVSFYGLNQAVIFLLRIIVIISSATFMLSTNQRRLIQAFVQWKVPYEIAFMVSLGIRFFPMLKEEASDSFIALQLRGIDLQALSLRKKMKVYSYLFMPIVIGVLMKAQLLAAAVETRAFRSHPNRTSYRPLFFAKKDYVAIGSILVAGFFVFFLNYGV